MCLNSPAQNNRARFPMASSQSIGLAVVVLLLLVAIFAYTAAGQGGFSGRTDPFWTPHTVAAPTRRYYAAASGPSGESRRDWADTYWPPVGCLA